MLLLMQTSNMAMIPLCASHLARWPYCRNPIVSIEVNQSHPDLTEHARGLPEIFVRKPRGIGHIRQNIDFPLPTLRQQSSSLTHKRSDATVGKQGGNFRVGIKNSVHRHLLWA